MNAIEISTKKYGSLTAVDRLNLAVGEGELFGLLGVNGAGKTTTIKMLCCLSRATDGEALVMGNSVSRSPDKVKRIISISTQETAVAPNLTVRENLELIAEIYGVSNIKEETDRIISQLSLNEKEFSRAKTLSGGWQRRLSIAMALITSPEVLFLDEPTLGLDVIARRELWEVIRKLKARMTIVLTTHYLEEAESLCDRIGIMSSGRLCAVGTPNELKLLGGKDNFEDAFVELVQRDGDFK